MVVAGREDLHNFDVFLVVAVYFIGLVSVGMSAWKGYFPGIGIGFLLMVAAYLYERVSILEEKVEGGA
jgi:1,4-dihydroxy-2-naphthoate octaprenyltransferase